jgi:UDP-N-acetyl-D-mannosaminuronic acid transferase (WecB/TagA/CpsF family)
MHFFTLDIYNGRYREFLEIIKNPTQKTLVFTPNPEILVRVSRDREFLDILSQADYLVPDAN